MLPFLVSPLSPFPLTPSFFSYRQPRIPLRCHFKSKQTGGMACLLSTQWHAYYSIEYWAIK